MPLRWTNGRPLRILAWDLENRPLSYAGSDWTTAEVTAIAAMWIGGKRAKCWALGEVLTDKEGVAYRRTAEEMLLGFKRLYDQSDLVSGHFIRKHDLPMLNGALLELGLPTLGPKLTCDTYMDLVKRKDLSASQESLGEMFGLTHPKEHMSQPKWRQANRLTPAGIKETRRRVIGDVRQHVQLRQALLDRRLLKPPRVWTP